MALKSKLMSMTGDSDYNPEPEDTEDDMMEDDMEGGYPEEDMSFYDGGSPEEPDVMESNLGLSQIHRMMLQQADMYFNPAADTPEIGEDERERFNPWSDPYARDSQVAPMEDMNSAYNERVMHKDEIKNSLQEKAKMRAMATAKFQKMLSGKK